MNSIEFEIKGLRPLMFSKEPDPYEQAPDGQKGRKTKDLKPVEIARLALHTAKNGKGTVAVLPAHVMKKCLLSVVSITLGRSSANHPWMQIVKGGIAVEPDDLVLEPQDWTLDIRRAGTKGRGTGALLYRPRFDAWQFSGRALYDDGRISEEQLRSLFDNAGTFDGLGAYRIGLGGPFGKFQVTEWKQS
jgi:hypothetical protein